MHQEMGLRWFARLVPRAASLPVFSNAARRSHWQRAASGTPQSPERSGLVVNQAVDRRGLGSVVATPFAAIRRAIEQIAPARSERCDACISLVGVASGRHACQTNDGRYVA